MAKSYTLSEIWVGLRDLEIAMERDPVCTVWALPAILERQADAEEPAEAGSRTTDKQDG